MVEAPQQPVHESQATYKYRYKENIRTQYTNTKDKLETQIQIQETLLSNRPGGNLSMCFKQRCDHSHRFLSTVGSFKSQPEEIVRNNTTYVIPNTNTVYLKYLRRSMPSSLGWRSCGPLKRFHTASLPITTPACDQKM